MSNAKVKVASGLIKGYMKACGFKGWTSFWNTVYVLEGYQDNTRLLRHEMKHIEQIKRDGKVLFSVRYLWWFLRYGYYENPYEVEARQAETFIN